jgi:hypothetical protein
MGEIHPVNINRNSPEGADILYNTKAILKAGAAIAVVSIPISIPVTIAIFAFLKHLECGDFKRRPDKGP